jgi:hypothetical protein
MRKRLAADNGGEQQSSERQSSNRYVSEVLESVVILNNRLHV